MASNSLGKHFRITSFGESHGPHVGVIIDGCPSNYRIDLDHVQHELNRRRPGQSTLTTARSEADAFEITSGLHHGRTTGAPICILIPNTNQRPQDYDDLATVYRPSHADFTYEQKYGIRDARGGGRSSARITAAWVAAGAIAQQLLKQHFGINITSYVSQIHTVQCPKSIDYSIDEIEKSVVRCPDAESSKRMEEAIFKAKNEGDSLGGIISAFVTNVPVGLGNPVFEKFSATLAQAMFSLNAVKGFQIGSGFDSVLYTGSQLNDAWTSDGDKATTSTNNSGGIQGGITNGMPILFDVAFKPTSSIGKTQRTIDVDLNQLETKITGRHDPCVVPRAVPIVDALTALCLMDELVHQIPVGTS